MSNGNSKPYKHLIDIMKAQQIHPYGDNGIVAPSVTISTEFYMKCLYKMQLLQNMGKLEPKEVANAIHMLDSKDEADWVVVEEIIKNKFLEI